MPEGGRQDLTDENRCWPCTVANMAVGVLIASVPVAGAIVREDTSLLAVAVLWAVAVLGYTLYRLVDRGYLPYSGRIARFTGLHERIGPGRKED